MLDAVKYDQSLAHDGLIAQWFVEMQQAADLERVFMPDCQAIGRLFAFFQRPGCDLIFQVQDGRIVRAAWFEPVMSGAFVGLWFAAGLRGKSAPWFRAACLLAFQTYPVLVAITKQEKLLDIMERFGYTTLGPIPSLWQGEPVWVLTLTREGLTNEYGRRKVRGRSERGRATGRGLGNQTLDREREGNRDVPPDPSNGDQSRADGASDRLCAGSRDS